MVADNRPGVATQLVLSIPINSSWPYLFLVKNSLAGENTGVYIAPSRHRCRLGCEVTGQLTMACVLNTVVVHSAPPPPPPLPSLDTPCNDLQTDALVMMGALDSLHRLFGADGRAVAAVRNAGLSALNAAGPVKRRLARHAMGGK